MSGHSKWSNIKYKKSKEDNRKSRIFNRLIREIYIAGQDQKKENSKNIANFKLKKAIQNAYAANMPKNTIDRAIKKINEKNLQKFENIRYEGYVLFGVACIIDTITNNRNRTVSKIREIFKKYGGNLGRSGSVSYLFLEKGILSFHTKNNEDRILEIAIKVKAEDINIKKNGFIDIITTPNKLISILEKIKIEKIYPYKNKIIPVAISKIMLDKNKNKEFSLFMNDLKNIEDVQNIYTNAKII